MVKEHSFLVIVIFFFFLFLSVPLSGSSSTTGHDMINPPTVFPTNPATTPPLTFPPATATPTNPAATPVTIPSTAPPVTTPGIVAGPVTNPVTQYPAPGENVPAVVPPAVTNAPATPGQSWCVAKPGAPQLALQEALDYACGTGGADCSQIQQGGNCYNPNTIQNHASYAFNSYYQKNPSPLSCDFSGTAAIVSTNPSSGSCIFPSSSSTSSSAPAVTIPTPTTQTVTPPATPTTAPIGGGVSGSAATPPPVFNPANPISNTPTNPNNPIDPNNPTNLNSPTNPALGNPALGNPAVYGFDGSPTNNISTTSVSTQLQIFFGQVMVITFTLAGVLVL